ncbi:esterase-like activity of phytase family protein [Hephaestia mangrovi]|uniref:esterase-like activity of phytase family protein n=1 Tax=Hephaestia mangrovi TaxID=2873268 RepID=UPI0021081802|nr:esterase-like activity of phytase family protein [Hephaestia mangrovi]
MRRLSGVQPACQVALRSNAAIAAAVRLLFSILIVLLLVPSYATVPPEPRLAAMGRMTVRKVVLDSSDPARRHVGRLTWLGGIALSSDDPAFGGFSSMSLVGDRFTLLSDGGNFIDFRMDGDWRIGDLHFGNLPDGPGTGWEKSDRDSESMARDPKTGDIWVGFEVYNAIWRYSAGFAHAEAHVRPKDMAKWPIAGGPESMVRLRDGHFVVFGETAHWPHDHAHAARWFDHDPTIDPTTGFRFDYAPPHGYDPSDAVELPDGDLLVLNRRFQLPYTFTAILTIVPRAEIAPGKTAIGTPIATFAAPLIHDNFEALAVTREGKDTIIWMASDDNQSILERSLLLKFRLDPPETTKTPPWG